MKLRILLFFVLGLFIAFPGLSQKETRNVSNFHRVSFGIPGDLYLKQGSVQSVRLEGEQDDLDKIKTEVVNGQLRIYIEDHRWWNWNFSNNVEVYITVPEIDGVSLGGSGKVMSDGSIRSDNMDLSVSGSGRMEMDVKADRMKLDVSGSGHMDLKVDGGDIDQQISGSGSITLEGNAENCDLDISGSGKLDAFDMNAKSYTISISGSGRSSVSVSQAITANISGSGSVVYRGSPDMVISKVSGSGRVRKMD
jgi:Putative auto-transporter adhesin, head GIN domain